MRITAIFWQSHVTMLDRASRDVPDVTLDLFASKTLDADEDAFAAMAASLARAEAVVVYRSGEAVWSRIETALADVPPSVPVVCLSHDPSLWAQSSVPLPVVRRCYDYVVYGGRENFANLLRTVAGLVRGDAFADAPPAVRQPWEGLWHPKAPQASFADREAFDAWHAGYLAAKGLADAPRVGMLFSRHFWVNDNAAPEAAIIDCLEAEGLAVVPLFSHGVRDANIGNLGSLAAARAVFAPAAGRRPIEALVKLSTFFLGREHGAADDGRQAAGGVELFTDLNVPVFQPVVSTSRSLEEWQADPQGLGSEVAWMVAMPEFEGVVEPLFVGGVSRDGTSGSGASLENPRARAGTLPTPGQAGGPLGGPAPRSRERPQGCLHFAQQPLRLGGSDRRRRGQARFPGNPWPASWPPCGRPATTWTSPHPARRSSTTS